MLVSPYRQHLQYLFIEQLDISVSPLLQLVSDSISTSTNGLIKHFMAHGEMSMIILRCQKVINTKESS